MCRKALEKDPNRRYATARRLTADIRAYCEVRKVSITRPSLFERAVGWSRRRPGRAALTLAALASLSILAVFIGAQVWVDLELADKALASLAAADAEIA